MKMITNLSKTLCKKDDRFKLVKEWNEGWRTFSYTSPESGESIALDTERRGGKTFLHIDIWNEPNEENKSISHPFTPEEWRDTAESELVGLFNGVETFSVERLACVCEKVMRGVKRLTAEVQAQDEPDMTPVVERLNVELELVDALIAEGKAMEWWRLSGLGYKDWDLRDAAHYLGYVMDDREDIVNWKPSENRAENKEWLEKVKNYGYMYFEEDGFHANGLRESIDKCKRLAEEEV